MICAGWREGDTTHECGKEFTPTGPRSLRCPDCSTRQRRANDASLLRPKAKQETRKRPKTVIDGVLFCGDTAVGNLPSCLSLREKLLTFSPQKSFAGLTRIAFFNGILVERGELAR